MLAQTYSSSCSEDWDRRALEVRSSRLAWATQQDLKEKFNFLYKRKLNDIFYSVISQGLYYVHVIIQILYIISINITFKVFIFIISVEWYTEAVRGQPLGADSHLSL